MIPDEWMHWEEALEKLGSPWERRDNFLAKVNKYGGADMLIRVFDGSEHELARKDHILTNSGPESFQKLFR